jgi:two-component system sensor kinase FixL
MNTRSLAPRLRRLFARRPALTRYGGACLAWAAASLAAVATQPVFPEVAHFFLFPVVCGSAVLAGGGPGLLATALGAPVVYGLAHADHAASATAYVAIGALTSLGGEWIYRRQGIARQLAHVLAEREAHLRSIFDTAPDGLIVIDESGVIQSYSAAAERMFGWSPSEVLGRNVNMLMPMPDRVRHDGHIRSYLETGTRRIIGIGRIVSGERKGGATFPMELAVGEVRSDHGRYFTGFVRDLTERQAAEARLQELQAELVHISRLTAMGEMASALAHELNQPLSAIANYMSGGRRLLERSKDADPRAIEALDKANEQALRAGEIIRRLREFLSRGEGERRAEPLPRLIQEACALAMVGAKGSGVQLRLDLDPDLAAVMVDRVQIQQVVLNLVRNAVDAMEQSQRKQVVISAAVGEENMALVSVADSGPGLDPAVAGRLLQPFVTTKATGMGVGLSISRTIVEAHGGRIWTEPNPGGGAVFKFTVRLALKGAGTDG